MSASDPAVVKRILEGFDPVKHGLSEDFLLTKLTAMKGCGCKVPRAVLLELLEGLNEEGVKTDEEVGIGLDSCVIPLRHEGMFLVQTTDFFYPLIDDPYLMGRVTCANVLSDLYAMGVVSCDNMLMLLGVAKDMNDKERDVIVGQFMQGFKDAASFAGTKIRGGQTVRCPWLLLGGVGTSVVTQSEMSAVDAAEPGDLLVLTKPIGGQVAVNSYEWLKNGSERFTQLELDEKKVRRAFQQVCEQMTRLNINAAKMLLKHRAHASTDVTGFGILGHADNLAKAQKAKVQFVIDTLPVIEYMDEISKRMPGGNGFNLFGGTSAETSGGLLVALPKDKAEQFIKDLQEIDGFPAWIIGRVEGAPDGVDNRGVVSDKYTVVPVPSSIH
uniref:Selenide, water dikinase n=1 Tax=Steinernema glaseri TaxID=37863 RepID=A0A1I7YNK3_9BILA